MLLALRSLYEAAAPEVPSGVDALAFNNTGSAGGYFEFTAPALPNADWSVGFCIRLDDRSATSSYQYVLSGGSLGLAGSFQLFVPAQSVDSSTPYYVRHLPEEGGTELNISAAPGVTTAGDGTNFWFFIQRVDTVYEFYIVPMGTTVSAANSEAPVVTGTVASKIWRIGGRTDSAASRWLLNPFGEFFILTNDSLTIAEINTLATGKHITEVRSTRAVDLRFRGNNATEPDLSGNGRNATRYNPSYFSLVDSFFPNAVSTPKRAMTLTDGRYNMVPTILLGTGIKPLVMLANGQKKLRATTEGTPLVYDDAGRMRTLASTETLEI